MAAAPPPPPATGKKNWIKQAATGSQEVWNVSHNTKPLPLVSINWANVVGYRGTSSSSVFVVGFPGDLAVVLKCSSTGLSDAFTQKIGELAGFPLCGFALIGPDQSEEKKQISEALARVDKLKEAHEQGKYNRLFEFPFLLAFEFVPGNRLDSMASNNLKVTDPWGKKALHNMGVLLSFDVLINNWDRIPLLWNHEGNVGNFLFLEGQTDRPIVGIDQCVTSIMNTGHKEYLQKVQSLVEELLAHPPSSPGVLETRLLPFINQNTTLNINNAHLVVIAKGMLSGFLTIAESINAKNMENVYNGLYKQVIDYLHTLAPGKGDRENFYGLAFVFVPYLVDIISLLAARKTRIVEKIKSLENL